MPCFQAHVVRFHLPEPKSIQNAALSDNEKHLVLSRSDGSLELWDVSCALLQSGGGGAPACLIQLPGAEGGSVEALTWCGHQLYSTGLHGHVLQHHPAGLHVVGSASVSGGAVWCLATDGKRGRLASGAEDGSITVHQCTEQGLVFDKRLAKQEKRILCLSWGRDGEHIAAGSVNTVCLLNAHSGRLVSRIAIGREARRRETVVWSVALLDDLTVVTGDSRGLVSFWDGRLGTLRHAVKSHAADVMVLAVGADQSAICAAGVDPTVAELRRVPVRADNAGGATTSTGWVKTCRLELHTRDVRVLIATDRWRISAGVDADIVFDVRGRKGQTIRTSPLPQTGYSIMPAPLLPGVAINTGTSLQLWRLPSASAPPADASSTDSSSLQLLVELQYRGSGERALCCAVAPDGSWLAYSTRRSRLRLLHVDLTGPRPALQPLRSLQQPPTAARHMRFSGDQLVLVTQCQQLVRYRLAGGGEEAGSDCMASDDEPPTMELLHERQEADDDDVAGRSERYVHLLEVDPEGSWAALASLDGRVTVYSLDERKGPGDVPQVRVPSRQCPATAMTFRPACPEGKLLVVYADRSLIEYNLEQRCLTPWSRYWTVAKRPDSVKPAAPASAKPPALTAGNQSSLPAAWRRRRLTVGRLSISGGRVLLHDDSAVLTLPAQLSAEAEPVAGVKKSRRKNDGRCTPTLQLQPTQLANSYGDKQPVLLDDRYRHLLCVSGLGDPLKSDELLVVEAPAASVDELLPAAFRRRKYGVS